jgi:hypothetical protein
MKNKKDLEIKTNYVISKVMADKEIQQMIIDMYEKELEILPEGGLCRKVINGKSYLYCYNKNKNDHSKSCYSNNNTKMESGIIDQRFLSKKEYDLASALKRKRYIQKSLPYLYNNIKAIDQFLLRYIPFDATYIAEKLDIVYKDLPQKCYQDYIGKVYVSKWIEEPYNKNEIYPDRLIHITVCGRKVRSKSEAMIAGLLEINNIPFRYEAELKLGEYTYYPDFTILKPKDGEIVYWEHFGLTNNSEYELLMEKKMNVFNKNGIKLWNNLITTYDSENGSINAQIIHSIIKAFIL